MAAPPRDSQIDFRREPARGVSHGEASQEFVPTRRERPGEHDRRRGGEDHGGAPDRRRDRAQGKRDGGDLLGARRPRQDRPRAPRPGHDARLCGHDVTGGGCPRERRGRGSGRDDDRAPHPPFADPRRGAESRRDGLPAPRHGGADRRPRARSKRPRGLPRVRRPFGLTTPRPENRTLQEFPGPPSAFPAGGGHGHDRKRRRFPPAPFPRPRLGRSSPDVRGCRHEHPREISRQEAARLRPFAVGASEHIRLAQRDLFEFCTNPDYIAGEWPDDYWPKSPVPPSASSWKKSLAAIIADRKALEDFIAHVPDLTAAIPHAKGKSYLRSILLVLDHTSYHVGQLVMAGKLLGS